MSQYPNPPEGEPSGAPMPPYGAPSGPPAKGLAIASLILGIVGLLTSWIIGMGFVPGLVGLILAIVARKKGNKTGLIIAGLILSIIAILASFAFVCLVCIGVMYELSYL